MTVSPDHGSPAYGWGARVVLRPIGTPIPLGFVGLAVATSVLASRNLGWIPQNEQHQVAVILIAFAFPLQALATVFCFLARDAPAGAGIGVQGAAWLVIGVLLLMAQPGARSQTIAIFLFAAAAALLPSALTTSLGKLVPAAVMFGAAARFTLTGLYERTGSSAWQHAAGWEGIALAIVALYAALASDLESATNRSILPLGRHAKGSSAVGADLAEPSRELGREPGVRQQL